MPKNSSEQEFFIDWLPQDAVCWSAMQLIAPAGLLPISPILFMYQIRKVPVMSVSTSPGVDSARSRSGSFVLVTSKSAHAAATKSAASNANIRLELLMLIPLILRTHGNELDNALRA
jgi:hypothetical protein